MALFSPIPPVKISPSVLFQAGSQAKQRTSKPIAEKVNCKLSSKVTGGNSRQNRPHVVTDSSSVTYWLLVP
jgi:hypothetical protein